MANTWYKTILLRRHAGVAPLTWDEFTKLFMDHFLPNSMRQKYAREFKRLVQTSFMDVSTYNTKFCKMARYVPCLVADEATRVQTFVNGLVGHLYSAVAPQVKTLTYSDAIDLARKIENKDVRNMQPRIYVRRPQQGDRSMAVLVQIAEQEIRDSNNKVHKQG